MRQDERAPFVAALERARMSAYPPGQFVGQESFMRADEIRALGREAGIGPGVDVLDLCCGVAGPGRLLTRELGCTYLGVDYSSSAVAIAAHLAAGLDCRFEVARIPPVPPGRHDVVLMLETLLAFEDKETLLQGVAAALRPGGRFAFTVEEGRPLTVEEQAAMPDADTVWLTPLAELLALLEHAGLHVRWQQEQSGSHRGIVDSLIEALTRESASIRAQIGPVALDELLAAHRLWSDWLRDGRVRKLAIVAEKA